MRENQIVDREILSNLSDNEMMYSLDEIALLPTVVSSINSRKEIDPTRNGKLPIFVAPMTCILDDKNFNRFSKSSVIPIYPVTNPMERLKTQLSPVLCFPENEWFSVTLEEFEYLFVERNAPEKSYKVLIDCANGHMARIFKSAIEAKKNYKNLTLMAGNIANPYAYLIYCIAGIDYVRIGIGGGSGCTTSEQTGMHTSIPYMLKIINEIRQNNLDKYKKYNPDFVETKVIADGGVNSISKAIKCLALGADYVMMGRCFAQCEEACGTRDRYLRHYYGQSSIYGQLDRFGEVRSNPEGNSSWIEIDTTLEDFTIKFEAALRSAMSYAGAAALDEFHPEYRIQSLHEYNCFHK